MNPFKKISQGLDKIDKAIEKKVTKEIQQQIDEANKKVKIGGGRL